MWFSKDQAIELASRYGTPLMAYSRQLLTERAQLFMGVSMPFGHTVRYAMKANAHPEIIALFHQQGLHFDASSSFEAAALLQQGIPGSHISVSSQQPAHNLAELLDANVQFVATSLHQLRLFTEVAGTGAHVGLRVNPEVGDGHSNRTNTGGIASSFGLWHAYLADALTLAAEKHVVIDRLHVHVGSGADPGVWKSVIGKALSIVRKMPQVTTLDIGGGYKVARANGESEADISAIGKLFAKALQDFADETGRRIRLETEPGTWLVAHAGTLIAEVVDIVDTGSAGYTFLRLNTGMNDIIRPAMYGAQHNVVVLNDAVEQSEYVAVGHNCETGDILTPAPGDPERIQARRMNKAAIGDIVAIADTGAYCASFSTKGYNSFPTAKEIFV